MQEEKVQRLSEGYDFIEESTAFCDEPLNYQDIDETIIVESAGGKSSPYKILGKISGVFAPIGEFSRNRRLYSENLWPTVLANEEFRSRLEGRRIFSCLGHEDKRIDDLDLKEGKVSGVVSCLEVRDGADSRPFLYGEIDILDTPAGRILKAMHEGGAGLYVSSRGAGKLVPVPGKDYSMVLPEQYYCHCFDTVLNPGFIKAKPVFEQVKESANESVNEASNEEVDEAANLEKVRDCDDKICKVEKAKKEMKDKLLSYDGKPADIEYDKLKKNLKSADYVLKGLNKRRDEAANEELSLLKSQLNKLAAVVEKVVDDVYEVPSKEDINKQIAESEQFVDFLKLMSETDVSEDVLSDIFHMIFNKEEK